MPRSCALSRPPAAQTTTAVAGMSRHIGAPQALTTRSAGGRVAPGQQLLVVAVDCRAGVYQPLTALRRRQTQRCGRNNSPDRPQDPAAETHFLSVRHGSREEAIESYRSWLWQKVKGGEIPMTQLAGLTGRWLDWHAQPCHGDVLAEAAVWAHARVLADIAQQPSTPVEAAAARS